MGSSTTRVVVGEFLKGEKNPRIIGIGESATRGMRHGYVVDFTHLVTSVKTAISMAEKSSGIKIKRAFVSIGSTTVRGDISTGGSIISKADGEVTTLDIEKALADCEDNLNLGNKKVIQTFPISYRLDSKEVLGRPIGMRGTKLEIKALFVICSAQHLEDLLEVVSLAGVEVIDVVASALAGSYIALSERQKIVGGALVNIGSETTSLCVYDNGTLVSLQTFSIGGSNITNDIALGLKIPLEKAENLKLGREGEEYPKKKLDEIVEARLSDIFESIENHLKKIKRAELLPAGIVFVGGGANITNLIEFSKSALNLPSEVGNTEIFGNTKTKLRDVSYFTALGLIYSSKDDDGYREGSLASIFKNLKNTIKSSIKQLLP